MVYLANLSSAKVASTKHTGVCEMQVSRIVVNLDGVLLIFSYVLPPFSGTLTLKANISNSEVTTQLLQRKSVGAVFPTMIHL